MNITSDEVNYLVYRYLLESGFTHSSFSFQHESQLSRRSEEFKALNVRSGALINLLQKGLQYIEVETHVDQDGTEKDCVAPFFLLKPHQCILNPSTKKNRKPLEGIVREKKEKDKSHEKRKSDRREREKDRGNNENEASFLRKEKEREKIKEKEKRRERSKSRPREKEKAESAGGTVADMETDLVEAVEPPAVIGAENVAPLPEDTLLEVKVINGLISSKNNVDQTISMQTEEVTLLEGHQMGVFCCQWNPENPSILATASSDSTTRIWHLPSSGSPHKISEPVVLISPKSQSIANATQEKPKTGITSIHWHPLGKLLATASYEGIARIWSAGGKLLHTLSKHTAPIFAIQFNKSGNILLTGGADNKTVAWDTESGEVKGMWEVHKESVLDIDWLDDTIFASCSSDRTICVCEIGSENPLKIYRGHGSEINSVKWSPHGTSLASCSDDKTAKIWKLTQDDPYQTFQGHESEVILAQWCPVMKEDGVQMLATASVDHTIRLWDVSSGLCLHRLAQHSESVAWISFSPDGKYLASIGNDHYILIWSLEDEGRLVKCYFGVGELYEIHWANEQKGVGEKEKSRKPRLAVAYDHKVAVIEPNLNTPNPPLPSPPLHSR